MSDSIDSHRSKTVVRASGDNNRVQDYNKGNSLNSEHNYLDNLKEINIFFGKSSLIVNKAALDQNIHNVRTIFSECINDNVDKMSVTVLAKDNLKQNRNDFENPNSIHVNFDSGNQVLVYSWPRYHQFDENKWNNFLLQLEKDSNVGFIGTGPFEFEYEGFNYNVYPPAFSFSQRKIPSLQSTKVYTLLEAEISDDYENYESLAFSFSQEEANQIIENIKRSHQSIKKQVIDHYASLNKDFVENDVDSVKIIADVNNKTKLTSIRYSNPSKDIILEFEIYKTTSLHNYARWGDDFLELAQGELAKGADVNAMDNNEKTPLHYAAKNGHVKIVQVLLKADGINVNAVDEDGKTPFDLTTNEEIKALLKAAENPGDGSVDANNEGDQEEDAGIQQGTTSAGQGTAEHPAPVKPSTPTQNHGGQTSTTNAGQETGVQDNGVKPVAPIEPAQTEEQPSSFFGSLFSILMKPFSLIASFFGGFFSWLFGSDEPTQSSSESDQPVVLEPPSNSGDNDII